MTRSISASEPTSGFSQTTSLPAESAARICSKWSAAGVQMSTMSMSSIRSNSSNERVRHGTANSSATAARRCSSMSHTACTRNLSACLPYPRAMCSRPMPQPTMPTLQILGSDTLGPGGMPGAEDQARRLDLYVADLHCRLYVGVVGNVGHDRFGVRTERGLKRLDRVEIQMAQSDESRTRPRCCAGDALFDRGILARRPQFLSHHRDVLIA